MNLPNIITIFRIGAAFIFLYFGWEGRWREGSVLFFVAAATDFVDGGLARLLGQRTQLGAFLDPMADKLLMFFGFVTLTRAGLIPLWLTALVVARDLFIVIGLLILRLKRAVIFYRPTYFSKLNTLVQVMTLLWALSMTQNITRNIWDRLGYDFTQSPLKESSQALFGLAGLLAIVTGAQYFRIGKKMLP